MIHRLRRRVLAALLVTGGAAAALVGVPSGQVAVAGAQAVSAPASGAGAAEARADGSVDDPLTPAPTNGAPLPPPGSPGSLPQALADPDPFPAMPGPLPDGSLSPQIVGGETATRVPADAVALILYNFEGDEFSCTGTLVAPEWVLTAGHCLVQQHGDPPAPVRAVNNPAGYTVYVGSNANPPAVARTVTDVRLNDGYLVRNSSEDVPGYRNSSGVWVNGTANVANDTGLDDFGLLRLSFAASGTPVPLALDDSLAQAGMTVWAAGWGITDGSCTSGCPIPTTLQEAPMTISNSTYCEIAWHRHFSATSSTCYVGTTTATCSGDSGGPVMSQDEEGKWWLVAVISGGPSGCPVNQPYVGVRSAWAAPFVAATTGVAQEGRRGESFNPIVPTRIIDSRVSQGVAFIPPTITEPASQGVYLPTPTLKPGFVTRRPIFGANGVPGLPTGGVAGVVLNVTVEAFGGGYVAVYPCVDGWNGTSSVNFAPGQTVANLVVSKVDRNGDVCFLAAAETVLVADLTGWLGPQGTDKAVDSSDPIRIFDSRDPGGTRPSDRSQVAVQVTGPGRAPVGARAAVLNVTSTDASAKGFVTAFPCDSDRPLASSLNPVAGLDVPNSVMVQLDAGGRVCLYTELATNLVVDLNGWAIDAAAGTVKTVVPSRLVDTRGGPLLQAQTPLIFHVTGLAGVPGGDVDSVLLNVTVTEPTASGYLVAYPCTTVPLASNLNFVAQQTVPNAVMAKVDGSGNVCLWSAAPTHVVVDVTGYVRT